MAAGADAKKGSAGNFTADERAAMKERAAEVRAEKVAGKAADKAAADLAALETKIAELPEDDRHLARQVHELVTRTAPELAPRLWYGMPAYARDGDVLCFFQPSGKFKTRYSTLGFNANANLDDGNVWPVSYAITKLTQRDETAIRQLIKQAIS